METRWVAVDFGGPEVLRRVPVVVLPPKSGEVTIQMRAAGMNPADYKHFGPGQDPGLLPLTVGYEAAGVISDVGPDTEIASGGGGVGDEVVAFQILGGYASAITVDADDVFAKPANLSFAEASNLLRGEVDGIGGVDDVGRWRFRRTGHPVRVGATERIGQAP